MTLIIGVDPGASGAAAWYNRGTHHAVPFNGMTEVEILELFESLGKNGFAYLEAVHSMPGQGVSSTFKFGMSYGMLRTALLAAGIGFETVAPSKWQRKMNCLSKGDKKVTRAKAQELFPGVEIAGRGVKAPTHAVADALLIAEYGRRVHRESTGE
jgi:crossover junction endodeoxyribonuclease RuvC